MARVGLLMKKIGCTSLYNDGVRFQVTLLMLEQNIVLRSEKSGDWSVVEISFGKIKHPKKPQIGHFKKFGVDKEKIGRLLQFRVKQSDAPDSLASLFVDHFKAGQLVDVVGTSIGKGFSGVMKRHNFSGLAASHGVSISHRSGGSTGQCQDPGRVFKGKKMPGQLGNCKVTVQNLRTHSIYKDKSLIAVKGSVPGCKNSYVLVRDAVKSSYVF